MKIALTGHRPQLLGGFGLDITTKLQGLANWALDDLAKRYQPVTMVYSGLAQGWDLEFAEVCFRRKIPVWGAVPFEGQERVWPEHAQRRYNVAKYNCHSITTVCEGGYAPWKNFKRNEWMVNQLNPVEDRVAALFSGAQGGTEHCVGYARAHGVGITNYWKKWSQF